MWIHSTRLAAPSARSPCQPARRDTCAVWPRYFVLILRRCARRLRQTASRRCLRPGLGVGRSRGIAEPPMPGPRD
jgi:hypothetical protein